MLNHRQGRYADAEAHHRRALAMRERLLSPNHRDIALSLTGIASACERQARYDEAEALYRRALAIHEQTPDRPNATALVRHYLGVVAENRGRHGDAESLLQDGAGDPRARLRRRPSERCPQLDQPGHAVSARRTDYGDAEPLIRRSLTIREQAFGANHPDVATSLVALAGSTGSRRATPRRRSNCGGRSRSASRRSAPTICVTAATLGEPGRRLSEVDRHGEAETLRRRQVAILEARRGSDHPDVAAALVGLGHLQCQFWPATVKRKRS